MKGWRWAEFSCPVPPLTDLPVLPSTPREVLGLVDMVALENGELGSLLSPGTVRGLEDECVTDVKVPETWPWGFGRAWEALCRHWAWGSLRSPFCCFHLPFPVVDF